EEIGRDAHVGGAAVDVEVDRRLAVDLGRHDVGAALALQRHLAGTRRRRRDLGTRGGPDILAVPKQARLLAAVGRGEGALPVRLIVAHLADIPAAVGPRIAALAVGLAAAEVTGVFLAVGPAVGAVPVGPVVAEFADVTAAVGPAVDALAGAAVGAELA